MTQVSEFFDRLVGALESALGEAARRRPTSPVVKEAISITTSNGTKNVTTGSDGFPFCPKCWSSTIETNTTQANSVCVRHEFTCQKCGKKTIMFRLPPKRKSDRHMELHIFPGVYAQE